MRLIATSGVLFAVVKRECNKRETPTSSKDEQSKRRRAQSDQPALKTGEASATPQP
jgi:hypothetical protein